MKRTVALCLVLLLPLALCQSCMYQVVSTRTEPRVVVQRVTESRTEYAVQDQSLISQFLVLNLSRTCYEHREGTQETVMVETRHYDYTGAWMSLVGVAGVGLTVALALYLMGQDKIDQAEPFFDDEVWNQEAREDGEAMQATAGWIVLGSLLAVAAIAGGLLVASSRGNHEVETLLGRSSYSEGPVEASCRSPWPSGIGTLIAPSVGQQFEAYADGTGRVEVDLSAAPVQLWEGAGPLHLELASQPQWIAFDLAQSVRSVGMSRYSQAQLTLTLTFDDGQGDADGQLDPGEIAALIYEVVNNSPSTLNNLDLDIDVDRPSGLTVRTPPSLGTLAPGQAARGRIDLVSSADLSGPAVLFEADVRSDSGLSQSTRLNVAVQAQSGPERSYIWTDPGSRHSSLLATGSVRIQTVLTETGQFVFVADPGTRERINDIVQLGGGNPEDRLRAALQAANQENIRKVFELSVNPVASSHIQIVLSVYEAASSDRVFLKDSAVDSEDPLQVLDAFDGLARAYLEWAARGRTN